MADLNNSFYRASISLKNILKNSKQKLATKQTTKYLLSYFCRNKMNTEKELPYLPTMYLHLS